MATTSPGAASAARTSQLMSLADDEAGLDHDAHFVHETLPQQRADQGTAGVDADHADIVLLGERLKGAAKVDALGPHHDAGHAGRIQAIEVAGRRGAAAQGDHVPPVGLVAQLPQAGKTPSRVDGGEQWGVGGCRLALVPDCAPLLERDRAPYIPKLRHAGQQRLAADQRAVFVPRPCERVEPSHVDIESVHPGIQTHLVVHDDVRQHSALPGSMSRSSGDSTSPIGRRAQARSGRQHSKDHLRPRPKRSGRCREAGEARAASPAFFSPAGHQSRRRSISVAAVLTAALTLAAALAAAVALAAALAAAVALAAALAAAVALAARAG